MEAEQKIEKVILNAATVKKLSSLVANLPYASTKQKLGEVFRLAVNGGLDTPGSNLDTWDIAFLLDQVIDLLQLLESIKGVTSLEAKADGVEI